MKKKDEIYWNYIGNFIAVSIQKNLRIKNFNNANV